MQTLKRICYVVVSCFWYMHVSYRIKSILYFADHYFRLFVLNLFFIAEYPYLAKLIETNGTPKQEHKHQKRILEIFSPYLERQLNPVNIVPALYAARVINNEDKDEIMTVYDRNGATAASMVLLQLIQRRLDPEIWYHQFLKVINFVLFFNIAGQYCLEIL